MHGDLSETASFSACDARASSYPVVAIRPIPKRWDPSARAVIRRVPRKADGRYAADLFLQPPARGYGSAATLGTQPFDSSYLRTLS